MGRGYFLESATRRVIVCLCGLAVLWAALASGCCLASGVAPNTQESAVYADAPEGRQPLGSGDQLSPAGQAIRFYQKYISDLRRGRCRFEPSCSEYAREAIAQRGFVVGTALAADRLMRCNTRAWQWYERGQGGGLADVPGAGPTSKEKPLVPAWLLFSIPAPPVPDSLENYAGFADALEGEGDCWRAATEYKRMAFLGRTPALEFWAKMRTGACYFRNEGWEEAADEFTSAAAAAPGHVERNAAWYVTAAAGFNRGKYDDSRRILLEAPFDWGAAGRDVSQDSSGTEGYDYLSEYHRVTRGTWLVLSGLCAMGVGDWKDAETRFGESERGMTDALNRRRVAVLRERAGAGSGLPRKHPELAAGMSAILPGAGQVYCGRYYDGFRHFMFNALLIGAVYQLAKDDSYTGAYLVAGLSLPFYLGNVIGAKKTAESTNAARRVRHLSDTITLADRQE